MSLSRTQIRFLRGLAHEIKPVVFIGHEGLSGGVERELEITLDAHELVKVKLADLDRDERKVTTSQVLEVTGAELVHSIGKTITLFRRNDKQPRIRLPKA